MFKSKKDTVYVILAGIFITNAVVAELIGGKLIHVGSAVMSVGILPWPVVFITTDIINEHFGEETKAVFTERGYIKTEILRDINGKDRFVRAIHP